MVSEPSTTTTLRPAGAFALRESATFGFGQRTPGPWDGVMRLAFRLDGTFEPVGVELRQPHGGDVEVRAWGSGDAAAVARQVARVLSLDHDASAYDRLGEADPVIGRLQAAIPGLRPPLFHSPYEAAAWAVLSARRPARQMAEVRRRLGLEHGATFELAGQVEVAFPHPERLLTVDAWPGLSTEKVDRLHAVARAALAGDLDVDRLHQLGPDGADAELRRLPGIGPFYASLIVIRACGWTDVLPVGERRLLAAVARLYDLDGPPDPSTFERIAEAWRPFRTWASVLIRAAAERRT